MIISRTPLRASFVGGGTDLEEFYSIEDGQVLSTGLDKYLYVTAKRQINIVEFKYRIGWSKSEFKNNIEDIEHPIVRETLKLLQIDFPLEVTTFADVPANTGLGSSSAFTVGLLHTLFALKGQMVTKSTLASMAAHIEIDILKRNIGKQDHYAASFGNLNVFTFKKNNTVLVDPVFYDPFVKEQLERSMMLFYTAIKRDASDVLKEQRENTKDKFQILKQMRDLVPSLREVISTGKNLGQFGQILHEGWELKKKLTTEISSSKIDDYYNRAMEAGALGGKLLGAGKGGFLLFYVEPQKRQSVKNALSELYEMPFKFDTVGTRITYYDQQPY